MPISAIAQEQLLSTYWCDNCRRHDALFFDNRGWLQRTATI